MFVTVKRSTFILILLLITALILVSTLPFCRAKSTMASSRRVPIYSVDTSEKKIALSFDAAWGADKTEGIMDILDRYGVKATFFLVGFWVEKYSDIVAEIYSRGFEIGTHSDVHAHMPKMDKEAIVKDLSASVTKIRNVIGENVRLFRPPFGDYNDTLITAAEELGLQTVQWSVDSLDWKNVSAEYSVSRVLTKAHSGAIVLMHNNSDYIIEALPRIIEGLTGQGYELVPVGRLITKEGYVDNNGVQHRK